MEEFLSTELNEAPQQISVDGFKYEPTHEDELLNFFSLNLNHNEIDTVETNKNKERSDQKSIVEFEVQNHMRMINSKVVSFKINDKNELSYLLERPIQIAFRHLITDQIESESYHVEKSCVFWKYSKE